MDGHRGGVDDDVGEHPDLFEELALLPQSRQERPVDGERVGTARLGKAPDQGLFVRVEEEEPGGRHPFAHAGQDRREARREVGISDVENDSHPRRRDLGEERLDQGQRQVVDAEVAHVFEALEHVAFPGAGEAGHDDEALRHRRRGNALQRRLRGRRRGNVLRPGLPGFCGRGRRSTRSAAPVPGPSPQDAQARFKSGETALRAISSSTLSANSLAAS